jgi:hypothetical protein
MAAHDNFKDNWSHARQHTIPTLPTERERLLQEAITIVTNDRNTTYGEPEDAFQLIADYWNVYLQAKYDIVLETADVPLLMGLMKLARLTTNPHHRDSMVDVAGYMACLAEVPTEPGNAS